VRFRRPCEGGRSDLDEDDSSKCASATTDTRRLIIELVCRCTKDSDDELLGRDTSVKGMVQRCSGIITVQSHNTEHGGLHTGRDERISLHFRQYRLSRAAQNKKNRLPPHLSQGAVFHHVVISPGGLVETDAQRLLKEIGGKLGAGVMSWVDQTVSMGLVKLRAAARIRIEGLPQLSVRLARENSVVGHGPLKRLIPLPVTFILCTTASN
jgi:hypothetical protein